ncbi:polysaccharide biosynthesis tyrosine autokinase [Roseimaritima ulvae]|nr:polysaccharide biosynthesis tyrosine autokinase [Roseimaritima ulvae]
MSHEPTTSPEPVLDLWGVLRRRWIIVFLGLALGISLAVFYAVVAPKIYSSQVEVLVMRKDPGLPMMAQNQQGAPQQEIGDSLLATHMEIIRSPRVIGDAVDNRQLEALESIRQQLDPELARLDHRRAVITYILDNLWVERGGQELAYAPLTFVAEFRHGQAADCATVLTAITESYQDFMAETLQDANSEATGLIQQARDDMSLEIDQLENTYREFRRSTPLLTLGPDSLNKNQIRLAALHSELIRLQLRESELESRAIILKNTAGQESLREFSDLERLGLIDARDVERLALLVTVERGDATTDESFVAQQPQRTTTATTEMDSLLTLKVRLREEQSRLGSEHPRVLELRDTVRDVEQFLEAKNQALQPQQDSPEIRSGTLVKAYAKVIDKDLEDIRKQIEFTQQQIKQDEQESVDLVDDELRDQQIRDELYATKQLQLAVIDRLRQLNVMQSYGGFVTEILRAPEFGELAWPILPLVLAAGLCFGSLLGGGLALLVDLGDRSFRSTADIETATGAPMLGAIGAMKFRRNKQLSRLISPELVVYHRPESPQAEAYRHLRTALMFSPGGKDLRLLQMTSPNPGDGKTLTTVNLAASLGQTGKRVLLIDCDLRRPRVGKLFSLDPDNTAGLADVLTGKTELLDAIYETEVPEVSVMPSGFRPHNPSELLQTNEFFNLLAAVREKFDYVLLDSTPLLAVSESASIGQRVDGVVLALRTANTSRPEAERAVQRLQSVGVEPLGFVVNDIDYLSRQGDEGKYGYGYHYGAGGKAEKYFRPTASAK